MAGIRSDIDTTGVEFMWRVGGLVYGITSFTRSQVLAVDAIIIPPIQAPPEKNNMGNRDQHPM